MSYEVLKPQQSKTTCDVCNKEISQPVTPFVILYRTIWKDYTIYLCSKHGKMISKYIKTLSVEAKK